MVPFCECEIVIPLCHAFLFRQLHGFVYIFLSLRTFECDWSWMTDKRLEKEVNHSNKLFEKIKKTSILFTSFAWFLIVFTMFAAGPSYNKLKTNLRLCINRLLEPIFRCLCKTFFCSLRPYFIISGWSCWKRRRQSLLWNLERKLQITFHLGKSNVQRFESSISSGKITWLKPWKFWKCTVTCCWQGKYLQWDRHLVQGSLF